MREKKMEDWKQRRRKRRRKEIAIAREKQGKAFEHNNNYDHEIASSFGEGCGG